MICNKCGYELTGFEMECPSCRKKRDSGIEDAISLLKASKCVDIDYKKEYKLLKTQNDCLKEELEKYKQAYELETYERQKFIDELETYKKIAEKLAEYIETKNYADDICEFRLDVKGRFHKHCYKGKCKQCIIDWARKEVEK